MIDPKIRDIIKERRKFLKLRQEDIAEITGIAIKTIQLLEQGKGNPSVSTLQKIADVLGMEITMQVKQTH
jgi:transcriptional regulator with XRE-family HTH domain